jgi:hypothetical protein
VEQKPPEVKTLAQQEYDKLATIEPEREALILGEDEEHKTLTESQTSTRKKSDMEVADNRLFPEFVVSWLKYLPVACITPETFVPLKKLLLKCVLEEYPDISFGEAITTVETAMSIGLDREGRIDELALAGASAAKEAVKEASKGLI